MSGILLTNQTGWFSVCCQEYSYTQRTVIFSFAFDSSICVSLWRTSKLFR